MKHVFLISFLVLNGFFLKNSEAQTSKDMPLLTIAGENVKLSEFKAIYNKNNSSGIDPKSVEEYLELYINFKLKVKEAMEMGLDTFPAFKKELKGYREQLAKPYLSDKEVTEELIKEAYERMKLEVRASHILIGVLPQAAPSDTLIAYNKIMALRQQVIDGGDFETLAEENSSDPSAKDNKGDLGYFSALYMVYPFENMAYETPVGEVSMPIRTRYGYHIIKVTDKRPSRGEVKVAHIMVKVAPGAAEQDVQAAKEKIEEIKSKIGSGESFDDLAIKYSDDKGSAKRGGELPAFKAGKMILEFEEAAFGLKSDGDVSNPVRTPYGWHLIKRLDKKELPPLEQIYPDIKEKISRDSRSNKSLTSMIGKIKKNNGFKEKLAERDDFYAVIDSAFFDGSWSAEKAKDLNKTMFELGKRKYNQTAFTSFLEERQHKGPYMEPQFLIDNMYNEFVNKSCLDFEDSKLEEKYSEFRMLVQEYHDGILLFDLTDKKVWSKAVKDSSGLEAYYQKNIASYQWGERLYAIVYSCSSLEKAEQVKALVPQRSAGTITLDSIKKVVNDQSRLDLRVEAGKFEKGDHEVIDGIKWEVGITAPFKMNDQFIVVEVVEKIEPAAKELSEIRGLVTSDYQNYLEKEWIKALRAKYAVTIHKEALNHIN